MCWFWLQWRQDRTNPQISKNRKVRPVKVVDYGDVLRQFVTAATEGDFQTVVAAYICLDEDTVKKISRDFVETLRRLPNNPNKEMITSWLLVNAAGQGKHLLEYPYRSGMSANELAAMSIPEVFLRYIKDGNSLSAGNAPLDAAVHRNDRTLFRWLLRHGASVFSFHEAREPFRRLAQDREDKRGTEIGKDPERISDELLFALTTHNFELLLEYVHLGLNWRTATSRHGLRLQDFARMDETRLLESVLSRLQDEEAPERILETMYSGSGALPERQDEETTTPRDRETELAREDASVPRDPPSSPQEGWTPAQEDSPGASDDEISEVDSVALEGAGLDWGLGDDEEEMEEGGVEESLDDTANDSAGPLTVSGSGKAEREDLVQIRMTTMSAEQLVRVKGYLYDLPLPGILIDHFLLMQGVEAENYQKLTDRRTLELYRALKLYADDKLARLGRKNV